VKAFASTVLVLMSLQIFTGIEITTIDSWRIVNAGSHSLLVNKFSENPESDNGFLFQMERPHCLCAEPTFVLYSPNDEDFVRPIEGTPIEAELRVDFKKWRDVELEVFLALDDRQSNILRLKGTFPSLRDAKVIQLDSMYGSDTWVLKHIDKAMEQATKLCESFIPYEEESEAQAEKLKV
tara:strand:+ start:49 stop:588 length:540 start_codon:yes stop_codon:yes gene_type:complete